MTTQDSNNLSSTAVHEAAHAVLARVLDFDVSSISIKQDETTHGHVVIPDLCSPEDLENASTDEDKEWMERTACVLLAGLIAEQMHDPDYDHDIDSRGGLSDDLKVCGLLRYFYEEDDVRDAFEELQREAGQMVRDYWGEIIDMAESVQFHKVISWETGDG